MLRKASIFLFRQRILLKFSMQIILFFLRKTYLCTLKLKTKHNEQRKHQSKSRKRTRK